MIQIQGIRCDVLFSCHLLFTLMIFYLLLSVIHNLFYQKTRRSFLNRYMLHIVWPCLSEKAIFMPNLDLFLSGQIYKFGLYIHISGGCGINGTNHHIPFGHKMSPFVEICITTFYYFAPFLLVFVSPLVLRDHMMRNRAQAAPLIPTVM